MQKIELKKSKLSPEVAFYADGNLSLEGRSIPENPNMLFDKLIEFADSLNTDNVVFNINLEYFNTASSKKILELLMTLEKNKNITDIHVRWHFEEGDDDCYETAKLFEECLSRTTFTFHEYAEEVV